MIDSKKSLQEYLKADLVANNIPIWNIFSRYKYPIMHWQRALRSLEYSINCYKLPIYRPYLLFKKYSFMRQSIKLGFDIPPNVFGPGLSIAHWGTIVVNAKAKVGRDCRLHPSTCLGANLGDGSSAPEIGSHSYIGPGSKIFGGVVLGDHVRIGANAVVNKNFPSNSVLVGVPARNILSGIEKVES